MNMQEDPSGGMPRWQRCVPNMTSTEFKRGYDMGVTYAEMVVPRQGTPAGRMGPDVVHDILLRVLTNGETMDWRTGEDMFLWMRPRIHRDMGRDHRRQNRRLGLLRH
jgi:hypothetical protein